MLKIKNLRGECQHCGGLIEFHAEHAGTTAECPHCGQATELLLAVPPEESSPIRTKAILFSIIAVLILGGGLGGAVLALKRAERLKAERQQTQSKTEAPAAAKPMDPFTAQGFRVAPATLEKGQGGSLVYVVGTITNTTKRQRFGVKVELELSDAAGIKLSSATDYQKVLEPEAGWNFRALVGDKRAVAARVVAVTEAR